MRLFQRLSDILSANVSELVEKYEDPELLLKQAVREMEESVRSALESAVRVVAHEKILARQLADEETAVALWRDRATAAVRQGNDAAALDALASKHQREAVSAALAAQLAEATKAGQALRRQIESMRLRLEEAKRKLTLLSARQRSAQARQQLLREFSSVPIGDEAFQKFERMCRKVEQSEAEADALAELTGDPATNWDQFPLDNRPGPHALDAELRELKAQCGA